MTLLLDSHILVWLISGDPRLPPVLRRSLAGHDLNISVASVWELAIKSRAGKLPSVGPFLEDVQGVTARLGAELVDITPAHAIRAGTLDWAHRDPFDRMLVAQALEDGPRLVTLDERIVGSSGAPVFTA